MSNPHPHRHPRPDPRPADHDPIYRSVETGAAVPAVPDLPADEAFERKFTRLLDQIDSLPAEQRSRLQRLADESRQRHEKLRGSVRKLQDSLDSLRLGIKYMAFDLEATRRENEYLKSLLDDDVTEV